MEEFVIMFCWIEYIVDMATAKICPTLAGFSLSSDGQQVCVCICVCACVCACVRVCVEF